MTAISIEGPTMGAGWRVQCGGPLRDGLEAELQAAVDAVDQQMSTWNALSDLSRLNGATPGAWVDLPPETMAVLRLAEGLTTFTGGVFDIGAGAALAKWGLGSPLFSGRSEKGPFRAEIELGHGRARRLNLARLDLSAIAKGYGVDRLADVLRKGGVVDFLAEIDGEVLAAGHRPAGGDWIVEIERPPDSDGAALQVALRNMAVATSGDWRDGVVTDGERLPHIIDPGTGAPIRNGLAAVTVLDANCARADALATALMVMGETAGPAFADLHDIPALFQSRGPESFRTTITASLSALNVLAE